MRRTFLDPTLQAAFERDGYVILDAVAPDRAEQLRRAANAAVDKALPINDPQGALYGTLFDGVRRKAGEELAHRVLHPLLRDLLDGYRFEGGYILAKPPGAGRLDAHQHQPVTSDIYEPAVHCWLTIDDAGPTTGGLRLVPGSHRLTRHVQSFETASYFSTFCETLEQSYMRSLDLRAGQAVIFERSLLHGSSPNDSAEPRLRILGTAIPSESQLCILSETEPGSFDALEVGGATIDPELFCIARDNPARLRLAGRIDNRNEALSIEEFRALLRSGLRIAPGIDPIDEIRRRGAVVDNA
jgi:hypothetical protein